MMKRNISIVDKYQKAISIRNREEAIEYFAECVDHSMRLGSSREEAIDFEKKAIIAFASARDINTQIIVESLYGSIDLDQEQETALAATSTPVGKDPKKKEVEKTILDVIEDAKAKDKKDYNLPPNTKEGYGIKPLLRG